MNPHEYLNETPSMYSTTSTLQRMNADSPSAHPLIDWRKVNAEQWRNGIQATLGEDGELLTIWQDGIRAEHVLEECCDVT